ncbi:MAG TPA: NAD(+) diphosphatase [Gammaproteobacteria bacterium]|nr:NAD(+) diphosphatase [Gammaproteobacteria bacterium]
MSPPTFRYAGGPLDRSGDHRVDADWLAAQLRSPSARVLPLWRDRHLVREGGDNAGDLRAVMLERELAQPVLDRCDEVVFLGTEDGGSVFAADLTSLEEGTARELVGSEAFIDLRRAGPSLPASEAAILAYARALLYWHRTHRYCGCCGSPTVSGRGGHVRLCGNEHCAREIYPRTDPAVIMLVHATGPEPRCLLARHARLPPRVYTTLAGFVEPGESLEEAVAREVREEVDVRLANVRYQGSQPWPFPSQLMLGFRARAATDDIRIDGVEIEAARWFSPGEIRRAGEWGDDEAEIQLPRRDSIACHLIESWLDEVL